MITISVVNHVFKKSPGSIAVGNAYAQSAQQDIGLDWVGRQSLRVGQHLLYLRVAQSSEDACLCINEVLSDIIVEYAVPYHGAVDADIDFVEPSTIRALNFLLEYDGTLEEVIVQRIVAVIEAEDQTEDAKHLIDLGNI